MTARIAIVNRGEAAMRLIHAARDLHAGGDDITTIALHTDAEKSATFVREADEAYGLGPASARPYLDLAVLERALIDTRADTVWPGWGFVAEDPAFVELCDRLGVRFIGPSAAAMRALGDKIGAKIAAETAGVPVAPWSGGRLDSLEDALAAADRIGYPLMLKASAGGGGRGIRRVTGPHDLTDVFDLTRAEAERAFGSGVVFLESAIDNARHIEVQIIADSHGTAWALGVRDCSVQRRNQKVIEESASPLLDADQVDDVKAAAERLATAVGYVGAGTVEFLYLPADRTFSFLEVNTRLQVEHPITEATTSFDLVKAQLHVAAGGALTGERPTEAGHAIEARLNAEDPDRDFAPAPGHVRLLRLPSGPGIRVDTGLSEGDTIPPDFDSMIAKVIAYGRDRDEALARLRRAMAETTVLIDGGTTNKTFVLDLLNQPEVVSGTPHWADTAWIDRARNEGRLVSRAHREAALIVAAIKAHDEQVALERARLFETARGGRPQSSHVTGASIEIALRGVTYATSTWQIDADRYRVTLSQGSESVTAEVRLVWLDDVHAHLTMGDRRLRIVSAVHGLTHLVEVDGVTHRISRDEGGTLRSPAPALVVATPVAVGDKVAVGDAVMVLESMKMETVIHAPFAAKVRELSVIVGSNVETGGPLITLEPLTDAGAAPTTAPSEGTLSLPVTPKTNLDPVQRRDHASRTLTALLLGYDLPDNERSVVLASYVAARREVQAAGSDVLDGDADLLGLIADIADLHRSRPGDDEHRSDLRVHSQREHFHTYLQSLDLERSGAPDHFQQRLARVLAHYGVTELARSRELESAVHRIYLAQQGSGDNTDIVLAILNRWLVEPTPDEERAPEIRALLERLKTAIHRRFPVVGDLVRSVRFRWFDQPLVDATRTETLDRVRTDLIALSASPDSTDRETTIAELAEISEPIAGFLHQELAGRGTHSDALMLEVITRRHYRESGLDNLTIDAGDPTLLHAGYAIGAQQRRLLTASGTWADMLDPSSTLISTLLAALRTEPDARSVVVDLYLERPAEAVTDLEEVVAASGLMAMSRRVTIALCSQGQADYYTFRTGAEGTDGSVVEDDLTHGIHPMVARRANLWRLASFTIVRLDAPRDVLLYECVARENPTDRRLVAMAQVRQLAVLRDDAGQVVGVPHAERAIENCLEAIRRAQAAGRARGDQTALGHVWVSVWPMIEADLDQLAALHTKITPMTTAADVAEILAIGQVRDADGNPVAVSLGFTPGPGGRITTTIDAPPAEPLKPADDYDVKVMRARRRGLVYPYELAPLLAGPGGSLVEYDLDASGALAPVDRPPGLNKAGIIVGLVTTLTDQHLEGITRVVLCGDPTKALGAVAEAECRRIIAAIDLAERMRIPVEWYALSAGARIAWDSGTENMDWVAAGLKRIIEFTQAGGEINVVVAGINVGAQPYWNAEATMLMHTRGILVMTPDSAMVLTGKQSLDFSGGVSAEDNVGIGGYDRVMGPNGQAQYWAPDLAGAFEVLMAHYEATYVTPGESGPRQAVTTDPVDRDVSTFPHTAAGSDFTEVGQIFSAAHNPERKRPFDIRTVMRAVTDQDHPTLERWPQMADADTAVVFDARIGGHSVCLLGIESKPVPRAGFAPTDGPAVYTGGTLFPRSSKKAARAINSASGNRPLVVLANLSGFDGSPDSMRNLQLEYGAEIGRAITNFDGSIVFVVISRYHGGAFVVFSKRLNPGMTVLAIDGSFASVLGGAPAAAVVFSAEVDKRTEADPRVQELRARPAVGDESQTAARALELRQIRAAVRADKLTEVAAEFDSVHNIRRAVEVGSVDRVIAASELRPAIIATLDQ